MSKNSFVKNNVRKQFNNNSRMNIFIDSKIKFYEIIQKNFKLIFLIYYDKTRQFYVDLDVSH